MKDFKAIVVFVFLLLPGAALAEVSDKVATIPQIWIQYAILGFAVLLAGRYRFLLGLVILPLSLLLIYAGYSTLADPHFGPALIAEQGWPYAFAVYGGAVFLLLLHGLGLYFGWRRGGLFGDKPRAA